MSKSGLQSALRIHDLDLLDAPREMNLLYAITDRRIFGADEEQSRRKLIGQAGVWARYGVAWVQLREKDLGGRELVELARAMRSVIDSATAAGEHKTRLLIHGRADVAMAVAADGMHLPSGAEALTPDEIRGIFAATGAARPAISISCHTLVEVERAREQQVDCILFAPVFEKRVPEETLGGTGLPLLGKACQAAAPVPVFALGGVTEQNASLCLEAGSAGLAAIRWLHQPADAWAAFSMEMPGSRKF